MIVLRNDQVEKSAWKDLLLKNSYSSPFQTPEFYNLFNSVDGYSAEVIAIKQDVQLLALMVIAIQKEKGIKGYFSRRGIIYGGPLLVKNEQGISAFKLLLQTVHKALSGKVIYSEVRNAFDYSYLSQVYINNGWSFEPRLNIQLNLKDKKIEDVISQMKYSRRRELLMSIKEGANVREAQNVEEVLDLYKILYQLYNERVMLPLPGFQFFEQLFFSSIGKVFVVFHNNKVIGGSFCLFIPDNLLYTMYYAGLRSYNRKIFPTHLALLGPMTFSIENKLVAIDFMGAGRPNQEYGVRDYKLAFGGQLVEIFRYIKVLNPFLYYFGKIGIKFYKIFR